jgi:hypothetical protein
MGSEFFELRGICPVDREKITVLIAKSEFKKFTDFPISVFYMHRGHGLILYVDANQKVRGIEKINVNLVTNAIQTGDQTKKLHGKVLSVNPKQFFGNKKVIFLS